MRAFTAEDAEPLHKILCDAEVIRYMPWKEPPSFERVQRLVEQQIQHWKAHSYGWWALESMPDKDFIGWCGLQYLPETNETEVGYLLARGSWGKGIATATARKAVEFGFSTIELSRIVALVHPENFASIRVIEKTGMHPVDQINLWGMELLRYDLSRKDFLMNPKMNMSFE